MKKGGGTIALVVTLAFILLAVHRVGGIEWPLALVLLLGGALAAGFAASVGRRPAEVAGATPRMGAGTGLVLHILIGAFAIACMVVGGLWLVA